MGGVFPPPTRVFECGDWGARVGCACGVVVELLSSGSAHHLTLPDGAVATFQGCNRPFCARGCEQVPDTWLTRRALPQSGCRASPVRRQCRALPQLGCRASDGSRQRRALPQFARPHVACAPPVSCGATVGVSRVSCAPPASRATATARDTRRCSDGPRTEHRGAVGNMRMFAPDELWITVPSVHMVRSGGAPPREQSNVGAHRIFRKE